MKNTSKSLGRIERGSRRADREILAAAALLLAGLTWLTSASPSLADEQAKAAANGSTPGDAPKSGTVPEAGTTDSDADKAKVNAEAGAASTNKAEADEPAPAATKSGSTNSAGPRSLSVAPEAEGAVVRFDRAKRPKWVEAGPIRKGDRQTLVVTSEPRITRREALLNLDEELLKAARDYLGERLGDPRAALEVPLVADDVRSRIGADDLYEELIEVSVGPMYQAHARIQFDETFLDTVRSRWQAAQLGRRIINLGGLLTGVTATLGATYLVLRRGVKKAAKPETTRGLHGAAVSAILSFVSASVGLAISTPWV